MSEEDAVIASGIYVAGLSGAICAMHFCWDALQQSGLTVPVLFGVCTLAAAAPWVYLLSSERSRW